MRLHVRRALMNEIPAREILGTFKIAAVSAGLPIVVGGADILRAELEQLGRRYDE